MQSNNRGVVFLFVMVVIVIAMALAYVVDRRPDPHASPDEKDIVEIKDPVKAAGKHEALEVGKVAPAPKPDASPASKLEAEKPKAPASEPAQDVETGRQENPKLVKDPVDEPEMPLDEEKGKKYDYVKLPNGGGFVFERWDPMPAAGEKPEEGAQKVSGVVVPGIILVTRGIVELFGCGDGGKEHETVLRLDCDIQSLDNALTLAGFKRGPIPKKLDLKQPGQGSRIMVLVQWTDREGNLVTYRSEDLVVSIKRELTMPRVGWTYVAKWSKVNDPSDPTGQRKYDVLSASQSRSLVTTFRDNSALLDNPLEEAVDDTQFAANYMLLPQPGTPVSVIFRPPFNHERDEILALENQIRTAPAKFTPDQRDHEAEAENPFAPPPEKPQDGK